MEHYRTAIKIVGLGFLYASVLSSCGMPNDPALNNPQYAYKNEIPANLDKDSSTKCIQYDALRKKCVQHARNMSQKTK